MFTSGEPRRPEEVHKKGEKGKQEDREKEGAIDSDEINQGVSEDTDNGQNDTQDDQPASAVSLDVRFLYDISRREEKQIGLTNAPIDLARYGPRRM